MRSSGVPNPVIQRVPQVSPWMAAWPWLLFGLPLAALAWWFLGTPWNRQPTIVVGVLHTRAGAAASAERTMVDGETLAVDELVRTGGLLGRNIRLVVADGGEDPASFAKRAERLIREEKVDVIVGCATSASRRAVVPVVEAADHLLVCPARHEGFEESPAVVSLGPLPNQSVGPAVAWCREALAANRFFMVGVDDTWSRAAIAVAGDQLVATGGSVVGEEYLPPGSTDVARTVRSIVSLRPDMVCSLLPVDATAQLLRRLREAGVRSADMPVLLVGLDDEDLRVLPRDDLAGSYVAAGYLHDIDRPADRQTTRTAAPGGGGDRPVSERALSAYEAIMLWADAVRAAGTTEALTVRAALRRQTRATPEGVIAVDPATQHAWRTLSIGRVRPDGLVEAVWTSERPARPVPFPITRSRAEWTRFLAATERARAGRRAAAAGSDAGAEAPTRESDGPP